MWCLCLDCECQCQCRSHAVGPRECSPITVHSTSILWDHLCWSLFGSSNSMSPGQENGDVLMHRYIVEDWTCDVWVNWSIAKWSPDIKKIAGANCASRVHTCARREWTRPALNSDKTVESWSRSNRILRLSKAAITNPPSDSFDHDWSLLHVSTLEVGQNLSGTVEHGKTDSSQPERDMFYTLWRFSLCRSPLVCLAIRRLYQSCMKTLDGFFILYRLCLETKELQRSPHSTPWTSNQHQSEVVWFHMISLFR